MLRDKFGGKILIDDYEMLCYLIRLNLMFIETLFHLMFIGYVKLLLVLSNHAIIIFLG